MTTADKIANILAALASGGITYDELRVLIDHPNLEDFFSKRSVREHGFRWRAKDGKTLLVSKNPEDRPVPKVVGKRLLKGRSQVVGNAGMSYVAYKLARRGWNVVPTSRNARGIDLLVYSSTKPTPVHLTVQVKTISKPTTAPPMGQDRTSWIADFYVVCVVSDAAPVCYVFTNRTVKRRIQSDRRGDNKWLGYMRDDPAHKERWDLFGKP